MRGRRGSRLRGRFGGTVSCVKVEASPPAHKSKRRPVRRGERAHQLGESAKVTILERRIARIWRVR